MVTQCPHCRDHRITDRDLYGSPIFTCQSCGRQYYDPKFREAAFQRPVYQDKSVIPKILIAGTIAIAYFIFLYCTRGASGTFKAVAYLLGACYVLYRVAIFAFTEFPVRRLQKYRARVREASSQRLLDPEYQQLLVRLSPDPENTVAQLRKFGKENGMSLWEDWVRPDDLPLPTRPTITPLKKGESSFLKTALREKRSDPGYTITGARKLVRTWDGPIVTPEQILRQCRILQNPNKVTLFEVNGTLYHRQEYIRRFAQAYFDSSMPKEIMAERAQALEDGLIFSDTQDLDLATIEAYRLAIHSCHYE